TAFGARRGSAGARNGDGPGRPSRGPALGRPPPRGHARAGGPRQAAPRVPGLVEQRLTAAMAEMGVASPRVEMHHELLSLLLALDGVQQPLRYHPEGDALYHSLQVFDLAYAATDDPE